MFYTNLQNKTQLDISKIENLSDNFAIKFKPDIYEIWCFERNNLENIDIFFLNKRNEEKSMVVL